MAVLATAVLFATLHPISTFVQWPCFVSTGTWMDPSQIWIHRGIDSDARGIQSDPVLVPGVIDEGDTSFAATRHLCAT